MKALKIFKIKNLAFIFVFVILVYSCKNDMQTGEDVVKLMYERWNQEWYQTMQFEQESNFFENGELVNTEIWQEIYKFDAKLHIRFDGFESQNGGIYRNDSVYSFADGELVRADEAIHFLLLLFADIYFYPPEKTIEKLKKLNFNLSKIIESEFNGRKIYVIGTDDKEDKTTNQFWIDKEGLYVVNIILKRGDDIRAYVFDDYEQIEGKWVATTLIFMKNDEIVMNEKYFNISFPENVPDSIFYPDNFFNARW